jgi:hypothetical protein
MIKMFRIGLVTSISLTASTIAPAATFAVSCAGRSSMRDTTTPKLIEFNNALGKQIYVVNEERQTITRALEPRQELDPVCGQKAILSFSPGLITAESTKVDDDFNSHCEFSLDRKTGAAIWSLDLALLSGKGHNISRWTMQCEKTAVPVFDTKKNKF